MKRILITGGAGFVGSSLALRFRAAFRSAEIVCLDNLYRNGSSLNRDRILAAGVVFVRGDVADRTFFRRQSFDLIVDAAAEPSVLAGQDGRDVEYVVDTNLGGTLNVLEAARKTGARVVFLSTSRVYPVLCLRDIGLTESDTRFEIAAHQKLGGITERGVSEEFPMEGPRTLYGATKYASEIMAREYAAQFGVRVLINRCGVLAGPWQMGRVDQGIVSLWVAAHHYGKRLSYIGYGGKQVRDVLHVEDLADLLLLQMECDECWTGAVHNVGGGRDISFSLRELTELAGAACGKRMEIVSVPEVRDGDVPLYITDTTRVGALCGWRPGRTVAEIVEDTARWISRNDEILNPILGN